MSCRLLAILGFLAAAFQCVAADPEAADTSYVNQERWGSPWLLTEPEYPKAARERKIAGYVDVEARVAATGELKEAEFRPGLPAAEIFVDAVRDASKFWRLYPPLGADCLPTQERITTRVWFEIEDDKPRIFVSRGKPRAPVRNDGMKPIVRRDPVFPRRMITANRDGDVFARAEVDPAGKVIATTATAYPRELASYLFDFEEEARNSLEQWKFSPAREGETRTRYACFDIHFRLKD